MERLLNDPTYKSIITIIIEHIILYPLALSTNVLYHGSASLLYCYYIFMSESANKSNISNYIILFIKLMLILRSGAVYSIYAVFTGIMFTLLVFIICLILVIKIRPYMIMNYFSTLIMKHIISDMANFPNIVTESLFKDIEKDTNKLIDNLERRPRRKQQKRVVFEDEKEGDDTAEDIQYDISSTKKRSRRNPSKYLDVDDSKPDDIDSEITTQPSIPVLEEKAD